MSFVQIGDQIFCAESILRIHVSQTVATFVVYLTLKETPDKSIWICGYETKEHALKLVSEIYRALGQVSTRTSDEILT